MLVAAISDTHIPGKAHSLPRALLDRLRTVDLIIHAGDISDLQTLDLLRTLAPVEAVRGNVDEPALQATLPRTRLVEAAGFRIGVVHGDGPGGGTTMERARRAFADSDCIVFGHSHYPIVQRMGGVLMVNPGSPTDRRHAPAPSFALLTLGASLAAEVLYL